MGKELEYKLSVPSRDILDQIVADPEVNGLAEGTWLERPMRTTYYDSPEERFASRYWTLRHRMEGEESIVCVKTPTGVAHMRGEWQVTASRPDEAAMEQLLLAGAPKELLLLYGEGDIAPVCGAKFVRRCLMLRFPDGTKAELAADCGIIHGASEEQPLIELELELYEGNGETVKAFADRLAERYSLTEQPYSKHARARSLK